MINKWNKNYRIMSCSQINQAIMREREKTMNYRDKYKDESWFPEIADENYVKRMREDYPDDTRGMTDEEIMDEYNEEGGKYVTLWDHVGDAYYDYEGLADAFFELLDILDKSNKEDVK